MASGCIRLAALLMVSGLAAPAFAQADLNVISAVRVRAEGGRSTIEIVGTKKPSFTTFTMSDPARLVVDVSEAIFKGVPAIQTIGNGSVTDIRTASYGSDQSAIARVIIGFSEELDTEIAASKSSLLISVAREAPLVAGAELPGKGADTLAAEQQARDEAEKKRLEEERRQAAEQQARAEAEQKRLEEERRQAAEQQARAEAEKKRLEEEHRRLARAMHRAPRCPAPRRLPRKR
jgi:regulator of protease activity HflC (stomatin/prohibitin superfamily)